MKQLLFTFGLLAASFPAQAQLAQLVGLGVGLGVHAATRNRAGKPSEYVTKATYRGQTFAQKRTTTAKLPKKGGAEINQVEELLSRYYAILLSDNVTELMPAGQYQAYVTARQQVQAARPGWEVASYDEEITFYQLEDRNRQYRRDAQVQRLAAEQAAARQRRAQQRLDSTAAVTRREQARVDSAARIARTVQDSLNRLAAAHARRTPVRYLNDYRSPLLVLPGAHNHAPVGEVWSASKLTVINALPSGWSYVNANEVKGYLLSRRLVPVLDSVTVPGVDWAEVRKYPDYAVVMTSGEHPPVALTPSALAQTGAATQRRTAVPALKKAAPAQHSSGPAVYYCASGNTVKYHASSGCRGLSRCGASINRISKQDAQQSMEPCKWCY